MQFAERARMENSEQTPSASRYRIEIKVSREQKELITLGAAAAKQGISQFVRSAAEEAARRALASRK
jgi:uncharacterized protein (DUF1778 family)